MMRFVLNPFFLYILSFSVSCLLYSLHWSNLFPDLSLELIVFLIGTFVCSLFLGLYLKKCRKNFYSKFNNSPSSDLRKAKLIICAYFLEFIYAKDIPLFSIFTSSESFVHFGGIPTFHVLLVTYNVFLSAVLFHRMLCQFNKVILFYFLLISIIPPLLMVNRGMFFTIFFSCLFIYLFSLKKIRVRKIVYCFLFVCMSLYLFAILGSARIQDDNNTIFASYTQPSEEFELLGISDLFLWPYMYIASPIGNLQECIDDFHIQYSLNSFFWKNICPDFISKKIYSPQKNIHAPLISPTFNVSTMYYGAYMQLGYLGMILMFFWQTTLIYVLFLSTKPKNNQYYTVTASLTCTVVVLNTFANMWVFSAISFPIIWGPVSLFIKRLKWS